MPRSLFSYIARRGITTAQADALLLSLSAWINRPANLRTKIIQNSDWKDHEPKNDMCY